MRAHYILNSARALNQSIIVSVPVKNRAILASHGLSSDPSFLAGFRLHHCSLARSVVPEMAEQPLIAGESSCVP
jgi:hypothetical protein